MLTVLLATRNGRRTLPGVLEAYSRVEAPQGGFRLVIVDNASTDGTPDLLAPFLGRLPLTLLSETTPGKNVALNRGLSAVEGDLVVFTDDDAFPRPDLLVRLRAAADAHPEFSIFGGVVVPRWEQPPPEWLRWVPQGPVFTLTPPTMVEGPAKPSDVFGPNMAIRAAVFATGHRFDAAIGPRGTAYAMGSEAEFLRRLMRQGHAAWHVTGAVVEHFIRASQMDAAWIRGRAVRFGRGQFRLAQPEAAEPLVSWLGVPRYLFRGLGEQALRMLGACLRRDAQGLFLARWEFNRLWGAAVEARIMRNETKRWGTL
jgi:glycosyltransferase involved in cell wall biosynthesis